MRRGAYRDMLCQAVRDSLNKRKPRLPEGSAILWSAFGDLSRARGMGAMAPNPITLPEIEAWCRLNRTPLQPRHVEIIRAMDEAFLEHFANASKGDTTADGVRKIAPRSQQAISPALFDAALGLFLPIPVVTSRFLYGGYSGGQKNSYAIYRLISKC